MDQIILPTGQIQNQSPMPKNKRLLSKMLIFILIVVIIFGCFIFLRMWWKYGGFPKPCGIGVGPSLGTCSTGFICQGSKPPMPDAGGVCVRGDLHSQ